MIITLERVLKEYKKEQTSDFASLPNEVNPMVRLSNQFLEDLEKLAAINRVISREYQQVDESEGLLCIKYDQEQQKEITAKKRGLRP